MIRKRIRSVRSRKQLLLIVDEISTVLRRLVITLFILVIIGQAVIQNDTLRLWLTSADRWEGTRLN